MIKAIDVGVKVVGGLAKWIDSQSDDCAAAGIAAVSGCECGSKKRECKDTGWYSASTSECTGSNPSIDNACGHAYASALAQEGLLGAWSYKTTYAFALAFAKNSECGENQAYAWASASVDGTARTEECKATAGQLCFTPPEAFDGEPAPRATDGTLVAKTGVFRDVTWPKNTILAVLDFQQFDLTAGSNVPTSPTYDGVLIVDGNVVWQASVNLDANGTIHATGDLSPADFAVSYDAQTQQWNATISGGSVEIPIGTQGKTPQQFVISYTDNNSTDPSAVTQARKMPTIEELDCCEIMSPSSPKIAASPNPFNPATEIRFYLPQASNVSLAIYDIAGRRVTLLANGPMDPGEHRITWHGKSADGGSVASGVYFAVLQTDNRVVRRKLTLVQ